MGSEVWEMNLKMINREAALDAIEDGKDVYIIRPVSLDSAVLLRDLLKLEFAIEEPEICRGTDAPEPPKEAGGGENLCQEETGLGKDRSPGQGWLECRADRR
ncbi:hypothetical protein DW725_00760 [Clostridiaceae bacterium AM27-36LB]|nr:hypothetical protein DW725_00760 [Clostridiaceae bacterium AM27-36LB]